MIFRIIKWALIIFMILNGVFFASNIYVLGNTKAAVKMHEDLAPDTGPVMANTKVIVVFITGILYFIAAIAIIRKNEYSILGVFATIIFVGLYIFQIIVWSKSHPAVWLGFAIFGIPSIIFGFFSWFQWKKIIK